MNVKQVDCAFTPTGSSWIEAQTTKIVKYVRDGKKA